MCVVLVRFRRTLLLDARASNITIAEKQIKSIVEFPMSPLPELVKPLRRMFYLVVLCVSVCVCDLHPDFVCSTVSCPLRYDKYVFFGFKFYDKFLIY